MKISLYTLTSALHNKAAIDAVSQEFISQVELKLGSSFNFAGNDFSSYGSSDLDIIYVRTGGSENLFKAIFPQLKGKILLLTSGTSNSLAASLEIISFLNNNNRKGEILHGTTEYIASRIKILAKVSAARKALEGKNIGVIGKPSDWLIASVADKEAVKAKIGMNIVEIEISELIDEIGKVDINEIPQSAKGVITKLYAENSDKIKDYKDGAVKVYVALDKMVKRYNLSALSLRCFDLLTSVGNTGCLALALLNAAGIPAGCEGDVPTLLSMIIGNALTGVSGFQCNPSQINPQTGEILLAHCTVPFNMVGNYTFDTHFESGIGVAIHGELPVGDATIFKVSGDLSRAFCAEANLQKNTYGANLCRTQIMLKLKGDASQICKNYFLKNPIGNHHVVFSGDLKELFEEFMGE